MTGICRFCGQAIMVPEGHEGAEDIYASTNCTCEGARRERLRKDMAENIEALCHMKKEECGMDPVGQDHYKLIQVLADQCFDGLIGKISMQLSDQTKVTLTRKEDMVIMKREKNLIVEG